MQDRKPTDEEIIELLKREVAEEKVKDPLSPELFARLMADAPQADASHADAPQAPEAQREPAWWELWKIPLWAGGAIAAVGVLALALWFGPDKPDRRRRNFSTSFQWELMSLSTGKPEPLRSGQPLPRDARLQFHYELRSRFFVRAYQLRRDGGLVPLVKTPKRGAKLRGKGRYPQRPIGIAQQKEAMLLVLLGKSPIPHSAVVKVVARTLGKKPDFSRELRFRGPWKYHFFYRFPAKKSR